MSCVVATDLRPRDVVVVIEGHGVGAMPSRRVHHGTGPVGGAGHIQPPIDEQRRVHDQQGSLPELERSAGDHVEDRELATGPGAEPLRFGVAKGRVVLEPGRLVVAPRVRMSEPQVVLADAPRRLLEAGHPTGAPERLELVGDSVRGPVAAIAAVQADLVAAIVRSRRGAGRRADRRSGSGSRGHRARCRRGRRRCCAGRSARSPSSACRRCGTGPGPRGPIARRPRRGRAARPGSGHAAGRHRRPPIGRPSSRIRRPSPTGGRRRATSGAGTCSDDARAPATARAARPTGGRRTRPRSRARGTPRRPRSTRTTGTDRARRAPAGRPPRSG